ncbi:hypothetical protein AS9A_P20057 (plasmid) [Hoyosella subflava DQS3-9A1]|uniref:Uncharacterized protein n=1 Tax=Hoyosella subflava (strain DSM 45089 / JCM 17490 / NBRC 109087 / DQS3-9A1) TaxID=443218 RepID=F6ESI0_HOYSD|nr:hypothetical protein AS9A_P20057 [Hoyosella subflava DQS3-9A1]
MLWFATSQTAVAGAVQLAPGTYRLCSRAAAKSAPPVSGTA